MNIQTGIYAFVLLVFAASADGREAAQLQEYTGVVKFHLIPAKVMKINKVVVDPEPGTSYIGDEGILVELEDNPPVMANWTIVNIKYYAYPEPRTINYKILSEQHEITVNHHAVSLEIIGDMSSYMKEH